jgi:Holliday junction resolvasome RuvABC endonuclease subunit
MNLAGVDLGIHKVALASFCAGVFDTQVWNVDPDMPRALQLRELGMVVAGLRQLQGLDQLWIEDTLVGNNIKYSLQLTEVRGAVMAAQTMDTDVRLVNVATWKAQVIGDGHASKDAVRDYIHVTHPAYAPLCGDDQDLYDAACIGLYGLQIMERAEGLRLAP